MKENVGDKDKLVRLGLGSISGLVSLGLLTDLLPQSSSVPELASPILGLIALVLLITGFTGKCGLYSMLEIDTN